MGSHLETGVATNATTNANKRWTPGEEKLLLLRFEDGASVAELAKAHGRSAYAIRLRLERLGVQPEAASDAPKAEMTAVSSASSSSAKAHPLLTIELVPETCWFSNVRSEISQRDWDRIRRRQLRLANFNCEICSSKTQLECHEVWRYDDARLTQTLLRMITLCKNCHEVKHLGRATAVGRNSQAKSHLARVNQWSAGETETYVLDAFEVWRHRSSKPWSLDISVLRDYGIDPPVGHDRKAQPQKYAPVRERSLADVVKTLAANGRRPRLGGRGLGGPRLHTTALGLFSDHRCGRAPKKRAHYPYLVTAIAPANPQTNHWVKEGTWWFWWDGVRWTGDREPHSTRSGWWQDPYSPGLRWWTGRSWGEDALRLQNGWVPKHPGSKVFFWWDGNSFVERLRPLPNGTRVRPRDRNNIGKVVGVDVSNRQKPIKVYFRNRKTRSDAVVNFAANALRRNK